MDDNMKGSGHPEGCRCGMCKMGMGGMMGMRGWGCGHHSGPMHIILKIVVIAFVFWLGTQVGELNAYRHGGMMNSNWGYGRGEMMGGGYGGGNAAYGPYDTSAPNGATTSTP